VSLYIPDRGDVVYLDFNPQAGHEQAGRRPALVLSPEAYNRKTGFAILCPITNTIRGNPFEVLIPDGCMVTGAVLAHQIKSLDIAAGRCEYGCGIPQEVLEETLEKISAILFQTC
jgi:mRNA interferase MazF